MVYARSYQQIFSQAAEATTAQSCFCVHVIDTNPAGKKRVQDRNVNFAMRPILVDQLGVWDGVPARADECPLKVSVSKLGTPSVIDACKW